MSKLYQETIFKNLLANQPTTEVMMKINKLLVSKNREIRKQEMAEELRREQENRTAWRHAFVPAYFESEWGRRYLANKELGGEVQMSQEMLFGDENKENKESLNLNTSNFLQTSENDFVQMANNELGGESNSRSQPNLSSENNNPNKSSIDELSLSRLG